MALNNSQYDEIFRSYDAKQLKAQHALEERTKAAYERSPELKALDASIAEISVASARRLLDGDSSALTELKARLKELRARKKALMKELSLPENYFEPVYECPDCKDTGYIDGKPCHCFKQQAIDLIYTQSNIKDILAKENFSTWIIIQMRLSTRQPDLPRLQLRKQLLQSAMNLWISLILFLLICIFLEILELVRLFYQTALQKSY